MILIVIASAVVRGNPWMDDELIKLSCSMQIIYLSAASDIGSAYPHSLRGQTFSVPRRLVVLIVITGQAQRGQACSIGSFHTAYVQVGYVEQEKKILPYLDLRLSNVPLWHSGHSIPVSAGFSKGSICLHLG